MSAITDIYPKGQRRVIVLDGPAGSGKGTVAKAIAERFDLAYLDTGALYRAVGLLALRRGLESAAELEQATLQMQFSFQRVAPGRFEARLGDEAVTAALRDELTGEMASRVAAFPEVRAALLGFQRRSGAPRSVVMDGRDLGTTVWPDADLKIFITADPEERARRRALELQDKKKTVSFQEVREQMLLRDQRDSQRKASPLRPAPDAVVVDNTRMSVQQSIDHVAMLVDRLLTDR
ncbi:MAG: (d)CMP kinase [Magnetococcus sp. WYHC-3]